MAAPLTPKPTRKAEALAKAPPTIVSRRKEDAALKEVAKPRLCCANGIFETKTKDGSTTAKAPAPRTNPNTKEAPTAPKPHTHPSHEYDGQARTGADLILHVVYYESIKRELKTKLIYECRCDERLTNEIEESIRLACTVLHDKTN